MSWLARSIANSLKLDDDDPNPQNPNAIHSPPNPNADDSPPQSPSPTTGRGGVKEDISELTKTLSRQFWGVASFLAPPPPPPPETSPAQIADPKESDEDLIAGIRSDFAEIGGRFKDEISKLSSNKAVSEFTKIASNLLQFGDEDESEARDSVGVTEEVIAFARNVALHPETWLDFPLPDDDDDDSKDFELSDAQQEHALAVERLAPTLGALRIELCPGHMSEGHFWKIYFVLLHPRLSKEDALLLSTPEIVEARAMLTHELQNRGKVKSVTESSVTSTVNVKVNPDSPKEQLLSVPTNPKPDHFQTETYKTVSEISTEPLDLETDKYPVQSSEVKVVDKAVIEEGPKNPIHGSSSSKVFDEKSEDEGDDWLKEEDGSEIVGISGTSIPIGNDEDVSFSDLEEEDSDETVPISYKKTNSGSDSSAKDSRDWVQL